MEKDFKEIITNPETSHWQALSTEKLNAVMGELRVEHGVSRKELYCSLSACMMLLLKNHGVEEYDRRFLRRIHIEMAREMDHTHFSCEPKNADKVA